MMLGSLLQKVGEYQMTVIGRPSLIILGEP